MRQACILLFLLFASCSAEDVSLRVGETYQDIHETTKITVRSGTEVDIYSAGANATFAGTYTHLDNGNVRVSTEAYGSTIAMTYIPIDEGLRDVDIPEGIAGILFRSDKIAVGYCQHLSEAYPAVIHDILTRAKLSERFTFNAFRNAQQLDRDAIRAFSHERLQVEDRHAFKIKRTGCDQVLIWDSNDKDNAAMLSESDAISRWDKLAEAFQQ